MYIHTSNLVVTSLNSEDKWRISKLEGKEVSRTTEKPVTETKETKTEEKPEKKENEE